MPERISPVARQSIEIARPERTASGVRPHSKNGAAGHGEAVRRAVLRFQVCAVVRPRIVHEELRPMPDQELPVVPELAIVITTGAADIGTAKRARPIAKPFRVVVVLGVEIVSSCAGLKTQPDPIPLEKCSVLKAGRSSHGSA